MADTELTVPEPKKSSLIKGLVIGIPVFIIQLIVVYFITANILLSRLQSTMPHQEAIGEAAEDVDTASIGNEERGKFIFLMEDVIINPAGTDGKRLLLTSIGFDVSREEDNNELKSKEVLVKDIVISLLSSKNIMQLGDGAYKDSLRHEIVSGFKEKMPRIKINDVYFSKYILQ